MCHLQHNARSESVKASDRLFHPKAAVWKDRIKPSSTRRWAQGLMQPRGRKPRGWGAETRMCLFSPPWDDVAQYIHHLLSKLGICRPRLVLPGFHGRVWMAKKAQGNVGYGCRSPLVDSAQRRDTTPLPHVHTTKQGYQTLVHPELTLHPLLA